MVHSQILMGGVPDTPGFVPQIVREKIIQMNFPEDQKGTFISSSRERFLTETGSFSLYNDLAYSVTIY